MAKETQTPEFEPEALAQAVQAFDRRAFLKLMGASFAAAGMAELGGCTRPQPLEQIVPYVRMPEHVVPGLPTYYASALPMRGFASGFGRGVVVESHEGRPTKIEGNPHHPSSLGSSDIFMQAAVLQLYDPDRSTSPLRAGQDAGWDEVLQDIEAFIAGHGGAKQVRMALLANTVTGPTLAAQIKRLASIYPNFRWFVDDPLDTGHTTAGQITALGKRVTPCYDFSRALRIVSLDSHFLGDEPGALRYARDFAATRRLNAEGKSSAQTMSRLYMAESTCTFTGAVADHRLAVRPSMVPKIAAALLRAVAGKGQMQGLEPEAAAWIKAAAADLQAHHSASLVLAGECQPAEVHAAAMAINEILGAPGNTVRYVQPVEVRPEGNASLAELTRAMGAGEIDLLFMLDVNPAYTAVDPTFATALQAFSRRKGTLSLHAGAYVDETAQHCAYHLPLSHALESWSDLRAHDGSASIVQPLIQPLWKSRSAVEILAAFTAIGNPESVEGPAAADWFASGYDLVRGHWFDEWNKATEQERHIQWRKSLRDGIIADTAAAAATDLPPVDTVKILAAIDAALAAKSEPMELAFRPDPAIGDGFYANHPWLQELPRPLTRATWENLALVGPATAQRLGVWRPGDPSRKELPVVRIGSGNAAIELPAWVQLGHPEETITLHLGGGRTAAGAVQQGAGVNVNGLRRGANPWNAGIPADQVKLTGRLAEVAIAQGTQFMNGRDIFRAHAISQLAGDRRHSPMDDKNAGTVARQHEAKSVRLSIYPEVPYEGYKWGMVVDLSTCIGCNACVIACQAENNIPTVGKHQVTLGREMHWIRIDTYYGGAAATSMEDAGRDGARAHFQPMMCQHCQDAPCEVVCPVEATSHSEEGINEMTYNRCVGTRYCSNNCPYKVRRFNFLHFTAMELADDPSSVQALQRNPNVTVRSRGVMEKCTYCIQRINRGRIAVKKAWAKNATNPDLNPAPQMRDPAADDSLGAPAGKKAEKLPRLDVTTACQQACPTQAIIFGDLNDAASQVTRLKYEAPTRDINYGVLDELNTQPRTSYLARLTNLNPALEGEGGAS